MSKTNTIFAGEAFAKSIFLAGPTPRDSKTASWRYDAIKILENLQFEGNVVIPEPRNGEWTREAIDKQVPWEWEGLGTTTVVAFWVPRNLTTLPGFITNIEYGLYVTSSKVILGYPPGTPCTSYFAALAARYHIPVFHTLQETMEAAVARCALPFSPAKHD